jgi:hypothetical protein
MACMGPNVYWREWNWGNKLKTSLQLTATIIKSWDMKATWARHYKESALLQVAANVLESRLTKSGNLAYELVVKILLAHLCHLRYLLQLANRTLELPKPLYIWILAFHNRQTLHIWNVKNGINKLIEYHLVRIISMFICSYFVVIVIIIIIINISSSARLLQATHCWQHLSKETELKLCLWI